MHVIETQKQNSANPDGIRAVLFLLSLLGAIPSSAA
jgi:hypothetical protein